MDNLNQPSSTQNQPTTEQQQSISLKSSSHAKTLFIAFVSFILLFASLTALILGSRIRSTSQPPPSTIKQPSPTPNPTANWKTYTFIRANSSVPKFQIKYPTNWDYREVSAGDPLHLNFYTSSIGKLSRQVNDTSPTDDPSLQQPLKAPIEIQVSVGQVDRCPCEDMVIAGLPAKKIMLEHWEIIELVKGEYTFSIMRALKDHSYLDNSLSTEKEIEIFNNMLTTFKFTNQKEQAVCTQDVKQCPDGSYVSRQPPTCEFAKCP